MLFQCIGNHEFDEGVRKLEEYFEDVKLPIVCGNADFSQEPKLKEYVAPSLILNVAGVKVGIIGYLNKNVGTLSPIGKIKMEDEATALRREITILKANGVNIIIGLGHSGYNIDQTLASTVEDIDIIVGGHTHTFLCNGASPLPKLIPKGDYPTIKLNSKKRAVPIVHAYGFSKFVGRLLVTFDDNGILKNFSGEPVFMDKSIVPDEKAVELLNKYRPGIDALKQQVLGQSRVHLSGSCRQEECNLANLLMDSFVSFKSGEYGGPYWTNAAVALINGGAIRQSISPEPTSGNITAADVYGAIPFDNILVTIDINGSIVSEALEYSVSSDGNTSRGEFLQFSGLHVVYNLKKKPFSRVESIRIRCAECSIPQYEPLDKNKVYKIVVNRYIATGGDGFGMLRHGALKIETEPIIDSDTLKDYIKFYQIIHPQTEERIIVKNNKRKVFFITNNSRGTCLHISIVLTFICLYFISRYK